MTKARIIGARALKTLWRHLLILVASLVAKLIASFQPERARVQNQPRPQGLLLDDFQDGGSSGDSPDKGWVTWYKISKNLEDFLSRDILR